LHDVVDDVLDVVGITDLDLSDYLVAFHHSPFKSSM
jgi:hypothetical protein